MCFAHQSSCRGPSLRFLLVAFTGLGVQAAAADVRPVYGQNVKEISTSPACRECSIDLQELPTIRDSDPGWLAGYQTFTSDSRGRFHSTNAFVNPGVIVMFDPSGRQIAAYGRGAGDGPGEGRLIAAPFFSAGDTSFVPDLRLQRVNVWSPELTFVRSFRFPGAIHDALLLNGGRMIVAAHVPSREQSGWPLHLISTADGRILRSFGVDVPAFRRDLVYMSRRRLAPDTHSTSHFWVAHVADYVIEKWDTNGARLLAFRRRPSWFPPYAETMGRRESTQPSLITGMWQDSEGLIWVVISVPDRQYAENRRELPSVGGFRAVEPTSRRSLVDTVIEVFDPVSGNLIASRRFDDDLGQWGQGPLVLYVESPDGIPSYRIFRPRLLRGGGSSPPQERN
jgi:hypothetical protein